MPMSVPINVDDPNDLAPVLQRHLLEEIMPFWLRHSIDDAGGINTCIADDGHLISREKWFWSQWRAVWVFSEIYRCIERKQQWLDLAYHVYHFCCKHGWDESVPGWVLRTDHEGNVLAGCDSIYVDGFAIYGATALSRATGDDEPLQLASKTAVATRKRLALPHDQIPHFPYPVPAGARMHGIPMMFSLVFWELAQLADNDELRRHACKLSDEVFNDFYRGDRDLIVERIAADGSEFAAPSGTTVVPGHAIEDMWFQAHIARDRGDRARIDLAMRLMRRHLETGWDQEHGGLFLAIDADGSDEVDWGFSDAKLWWPHTEALYGLLLCHQLTGAAWAWDWYQRVHAYTFSHYPLPELGEWRQKLNRRGEPITDIVALPVKDPFHLPRALILSIDLLRGSSRNGTDD